MYASALRRTLFTLIGLVAASTASAGQITTWNGTGGDNNWSTAGNWTTTPTTSGTFSLVFSGTPTATTSSNNTGGASATVLADSISFTNNGTAGQSAEIRLNSTGSRSITLVNGGTVTTTAVTTGTLSEVISSALTLSGSSTFKIANRHVVTVSGTVSGGSIVKTGVGDLSLTGSNSLTGLSVLNGLVELNANSFSGIAGKQVVLGSVGNTATLRFNTVSGTTNAAFIVRGDANITPQNSNVTFSSGTFNVADPTVTGTSVLLLAGGVGGIGTQTVTGRIQDNNGAGRVALTIGSTNTSTWNVWVLNGVNTYTGATTVDAGGRLLMNGVVSGSSTTTSSSYLGGTGTFGGAVSILSGTLAPGGTSTSGVITASIGKLTVGALSLSGPATTLMTISGSTGLDYDQILGSSSVNYGGTLALTLTGTQAYAKDTLFNLFKNFATRTGSFSSVTLAAAGTPYAGLTFTNLGGGIWETGSTAAPLGEYLRFEQSTGDLVFVPEPSTFVLAGLGAVLVGAQVWRRRRAAV